MRCKSCGKENANGTRFCIFCGTELKEVKPAKQKEILPYASSPIPQTAEQMELSMQQKKIKIEQMKTI